MKKLVMVPAVLVALAACGGADDSMESQRQNARGGNPGANAAGGNNNALHTGEAGCAAHVNDFGAQQDVYVQTSAGAYWVKVDAPGGGVLGTSDVAQPANYDGTCQRLWDLVRKPDGSQGFLPTTNPDGIYRVSVCTQSSFHPSSCKSDNFNIVAPSTWPVEVVKFYDTNEDELFNDDPFATGSYEVVAGWKFEVVDGLGAVVQTGLTGADGSHTFQLEAGTWTIREVMPGGDSWFATVPLSLETTVTVPPAPAAALEFGNACKLVGGGHSQGWWKNGNGEADFLGDDNGAGSLALLNGYTLRGVDGAAVADFQDYASFDAWLEAAHARHMGYMLSAQLAAALLSIDNGYTDTTVYVGQDASGNWMTVSDLLAWAEALLVANDHRANQELAKDYLDALVNNAAFTQPTAASCPFVYDDGQQPPVLQ